MIVVFPLQFGLFYFIDIFQTTLVIPTFCNPGKAFSNILKINLRLKLFFFLISNELATNLHTSKLFSFINDK